MLALQGVNILPQSLTLFLLSYIRFVIFLYVLFSRKKNQKLPAHGFRKSLKALARATLLTTPPFRIPCGANCVCTTHDYMLAVLSICIANSGTKELASRTPGIVWHTRSNTFVLIPLLERTRAVAQTVPDFFLILLLFAIFHKHR
jgi:hypothetical protein